MGRLKNVLANTGYTLGFMKTCPVCGKEYFMKDPGEWAYKRPKPRAYGNTLYFCSWHCLRAYDAKKQADRTEMLERQRQAREKAKTAKSKGGVPPITQVKAHYTIHRCGKCGKQVSMERTHCKYCNTKIDWGVYSPKGEK